MLMIDCNPKALPAKLLVASLTSHIWAASILVNDNSAFWTRLAMDDFLHKVQVLSASNHSHESNKLEAGSLVDWVDPMIVTFFAFNHLPAGLKVNDTHIVAVFVWALPYITFHLQIIMGKSLIYQVGLFIRNHWSNLFKCDFMLTACLNTLNFKKLKAFRTKANVLNKPVSKAFRANCKSTVKFTGTQI